MKNRISLETCPYFVMYYLITRKNTLVEFSNEIKTVYGEEVLKLVMKHGLTWVLFYKNVNVDEPTNEYGGGAEKDESLNVGEVDG